MKHITLIALLSVLAACGADGDPEPRQEEGIRVSGKVGIGVSGRF